jgi:mannose-6-phosphate isomerase-like protein (cupin superfamily)
MNKQMMARMEESMAMIKNEHDGIMREASKLLSLKDIVNLLSYDNYTEIATGIFDRLIKDPYDIKEAVEGKYADVIKNLDFDNYVHIFVKHYKEVRKVVDDRIIIVPGLFKLHHHDVLERMVNLEGEYIGSGNKIIRAGETQTIPAYTPHIFKSHSSFGFLIISLKKATYGDQR